MKAKEPRNRSQVAVVQKGPWLQTSRKRVQRGTKDGRNEKQPLTSLAAGTWEKAFSSLCGQKLAVCCAYKQLCGAYSPQVLAIHTTDSVSVKRV
jgi:hypothetical protein